jgi:hypothetical protein
MHKATPLKATTNYDVSSSSGYSQQYGPSSPGKAHTLYVSPPCKKAFLGEENVNESFCSPNSKKKI